MHRRQDQDEFGMVAQYYLGPEASWYQGHKGWEEDRDWRSGVLLSWDGEMATIAFDPAPDGFRDMPDGTRATDGGDVAYETFTHKEEPFEDLPVGGRIWMTERWNILAFPHVDGNVIAARPPEEMPGTIFELSGSTRVRFFTAGLVPREVDDWDESDIVEVLDWEQDEYVYANITGTDGVERFHIMPRPVAEEAAELIRAINSSRTWGEVRSGVDEFHVEMLALFAGYDDDPPGDEDPFSPCEIPVLILREYPITPEQAHAVHLPAETKLLHTEWERRPVEGSVLTIPVENGTFVIADLENLGIRCVEDRELLSIESERFDWREKAS